MRNKIALYALAIVTTAEIEIQEEFLLEALFLTKLIKNHDNFIQEFLVLGAFGAFIRSLKLKEAYII